MKLLIELKEDMAAKSKLIGKVVKLTWEDAWHNGKDYFTTKDIHDMPDYFLVTVGFVLRDNKKGITLSPEFIPENDRYRFAHHICRAMIRKVEVLK